MGELLEIAPAGGTGTLCLLGAGNCNDVDLAVLAQRFAGIHLVDLDAAALARACGRQTDEVRSRLHQHAPIDAGGLLRDAETWRKKPPMLAQIEARIPVAVDKIRSALPGGFDVVASCCVMTQIGHGITTILGPQHPALGDAHQAAAVVHLRTLSALLALGGHALLVTDLVSSETYPLEELAPGRDLKELIADLVRQGNYFKGVNPVALTRLLRRDPILSRRVVNTRPIEPWLWRAVQARTFLVNGFLFQRSAAD
ncbi:MAG: hypothetical protein QOI66_1370 [Myxococcales bacterium]|nr:hypothetical protein [Myxococcales bacterium]